MNINSELWHTCINRDIYLFTLANDNVEVGVSNYGCTVTAIRVSNREGEKRNIVLSYPTLQEYIDDKYYVGCIVGRFAGRINKGLFELNGKKYQLPCNENGNHLHGGFSGFNKKIFSIADSGCNNKYCFVRFETTSPHLEQGYPGELHLIVTVSLSDENEIAISYEATTNAATHLNLTHHHYFNLGGDQLHGWEQHLSLNAHQYLGQDEFSIPDGTIKPVQGTLLDFTAMRPVKHAETDKGFNEYFVLDSKTFANTDASLRDPHSGLTVELSTTYPCIVLYSGDYLSEPFAKSAGICLETQFFPDSPNQSRLPSTVLLPGNIYFHKTKMSLKNII